MLELGSSGSVRGVSSNGHPYRDPGPKAAIRLSYSITSSARARIDGGTARPSALAVLRLMTSSNVVGCWTGRSAGLAPLRILPALAIYFCGVVSVAH